MNLLNPTPEQIKERNQEWANDLRLNEKKATCTMRDEEGGRCCLAVAEDTAIRLGLDYIPDSIVMGAMPYESLGRFFGWEDHDVNPSLGGIGAIHLNDSMDLPHTEIAVLVEQTFCK